jgi:hypothetical protein
MFGLYENFPQTIHYTETFTSDLSKQKLEQKLAQVFYDINRRTFSFEETGNPTVPNASVIFEFGIADTNGFNFLNEEEAKKLQKALAVNPLRGLDWFCGIRYYKNTEPKKTPLKFDYYMLRLSFSEKGAVQFLVFHERGPRYISPQDLVAFIVRKINGKSKRKNLKPTEQG